MDIMANNSLIELDKSAREGDLIQLISNSYDDLDSINNTSWEIYLDGQIILPILLVREVESSPFL